VLFVALEVDSSCARADAAVDHGHHNQVSSTVGGTRLATNPCGTYLPDASASKGRPRFGAPTAGDAVLWPDCSPCHRAHSGRHNPSSGGVCLARRVPGRHVIGLSKR